VLQFPPDLYHYITADLHKQVILVLNKADLCPPPLVIAWKHYMTSQFPHLEIVCFTSHPGQSYNTGEDRLIEGFVGLKGSLFLLYLSSVSLKVLQKKRMRKKADWSRAGGLIDIFKACQEITAGKERLELHDEGAESVLVEHQSDSALEMSNQELYKDGVLTLGCIGEFYQI
ncbi:hypothetical protein XENOCAPTIV_020962, partial [Xenoophorus captivus]